MGLNKIGGGRTEEEIEDIVGAMADAGYGLEYNDSEGLLASTRQGPNPFDAAQSFEESDLTVSGNHRVESGSLVLGTVSETDTYSQGTANSGSGNIGFRFTPKRELESMTLSIQSELSGSYSITLTDYFQNGTLDTATATGGDTVTLSGTMDAGNDYRIAIEFTSTESYGTSSPASNEYINYDTSTVPVFTEVTPDALENSTTVQLEWPEPADLYEWDVATFTKTPDGETVDVFVAYDDGLGWTRVNDGAPISRNYSLADDPDISPSDSVRIEAELFRSDTANNPTLDSAYRSWVV